MEEYDSSRKTPKYFGSLYGYVRHEKFDQFLRAAGYPEEETVEPVKCLPVFWVECTREPSILAPGKYFFIKPHRFQFIYDVKENVAVEQTFLDTKAKCMYTFNEWEVIHNIWTSGGTMTFRMEFDKEDRMVMTVTSTFWDGTAKLYYSMHTVNTQKMLIQFYPKKRIRSKISGKLISNGFYVDEKLIKNQLHLYSTRLPRKS